MEKIAKYRKIVQKHLESEAAAGYPAQPKLQNLLIQTENNNRFILLVLGWHNEVYQHYIAHHLELTPKGKILIHEDRSEPSIKEDLIEAGVPVTDIIFPTADMSAGRVKAAA